MSLAPDVMTEPDLSTWTWSYSAAESWNRCKLQASLRYGHQHQRASGRDLVTEDVARRRGLVLHDALCAALRAADAELAAGARPAPGERLMRHWGPARVELGVAWERHRMPSSPSEAALVIGMLRDTLSQVPSPRPGELRAVEHKHRHVLPSGITINYVPDVERMVAPGVLRITDWKSGAIDAADVERHQQLHCYAAWLAAEYTDVHTIEIELYALREARSFVQRVDPRMAARAAARVERSALAAARAREPEPTTGPHCVGCIFRRVCPAVDERGGNLATPETSL